MSFPLIGNEKIKETLESLISSNRFPHAVIIEGEKGLGKHLLTDYLSRTILCEDDKKPCGSCQSCHLAKVGSHPDIITVAPEDKKKSIAVDQIRELKQSAFIKPHISGRRVFIIDKAETMNASSQNALLKILEEPPKNVFFILITESQEALLPTTLSRCITFKLSPPKRSKALKWILENVKPKREEDVILKALDDANGNIGRTAELLRKRNSDSPESIAKEFANLLFTGDEFDMLALLNKFEKDRPKADIFLASLKYEMTLLLRKNYSDTKKAKLLTELYSLCDRFQISLNTNINLALLFAEIVSTIKKLQRDYLN